MPAWQRGARRTGFDLDRDFTAAALGFDRATANSLDAVSDRDFVVDYLHAAALTAVHLSRLAEEIICGHRSRSASSSCPMPGRPGSSIMPNKRNPDAAELVRGHSARIIGDLVGLLVLLKGCLWPMPRICRTTSRPCSTRMICLA
jgi:argininosuccinate lyase